MKTEEISGKEKVEEKIVQEISLEKQEASTSNITDSQNNGSLSKKV